MSILLVVVLVIVALLVGFVGLMIFSNLMIIKRTNKLKGEPLPDLPGELGKQLKNAERAVLYFFSPNCAACRMLTPKFREMKEQGKPVHLINLRDQLDLARAMKIMATPTTLEIEKGLVVGVHVGPITPDDMARIEG